MSAPTFALSDSRYIPINQDEIKKRLLFFDNDPNVQSAFQIKVQSLFAGGIQFKRKNLQLTDTASAFYNEQWIDWCQALLRLQFAIGFAPCTYRQHDVYTGIPVVLDLDQVDIYMYKELDGRVHFRYFEKITEPFATLFLQPNSIIRRNNSNGSMQPEIFNVSTFTLTAPSVTGELNSIIQVLISDVVYSDHLLRCTLDAEHARAHPVLITELEKPKNDPESTSNLPLTAQMLGTGNRPYNLTDSTTSTKTDNVYTKAARQYEMDVARIINCNPQGADVFSNVSKYLSKVTDSRQPRLFPNRLDLDSGLKVVNQQLPEVPDNLLEFRTAIMERIYNLFSIPLTMLSNSSSSNSMAKATGQKNKSAGGGGGNSSSQVLFLNSQNKLKLQLIGYIKAMYSQIYYVEQLYESMQKIKKKKKKTDEEEEDNEQTDSRKRKLFEELTDTDQAFDDIEVEVIIAGIPGDEILTELYMNGSLTYDYYIQSQASRNGIDIKNFNATPALNIKQLNGVKEETAKTG